VLVALTATFQSRAQLVPIYSQYIVNQAVINPAYAGANNCLNLTALYRQQWSNYEGAPSTRTFSAHTPLRNRHLAIGMNVVNDVASITSNTLVEALFAYRFRVTKYHKLSLGMGAGILINKNNLSSVRVNDSGDEIFASNQNSTLPTFSFGAYFEHKKYFLGVSALNLNRNLISAPTFVYQQPFYFIAGYHYKWTSMVTLSPSVLIKKINNTPFQMDFNLFLTYNKQFKFGASYRTNDAVYLVFLFQLNDQLQIGYSYDYPLSALRPFQNGSHEISVRYLFQYKTQTVNVKTFQ
jgi:type IX secretion system PorP/SprF family membrane protein